MRARDTSQAAHELQIRLYRALKDEERSAIALEMSDDARRIAREGIQERHPEYDRGQIQRALVALFYGAEAAAKIWPGLPVPRP